MLGMLAVWTLFAQSGAGCKGTGHTGSVTNYYKVQADPMKEGEGIIKAK